MEEITGPVIATTLVLLAVFVPTAFMGGITGQLYRQFALTISAAVVISTINALTLSPALCGILMRPSAEKRSSSSSAGSTRRSTLRPTSTRAAIRAMVRRIAIVMVVFLGLVVLTGWGFQSHADGFSAHRRSGLRVRESPAARCCVAAAHARR